MTEQRAVSQQDVEHLAVIRQSVNDFMVYVADRYAANPGILLDVAPQNHAGARPFFAKTILVETLDIDPAAKATYTLDLCRRSIPEEIVGKFDYVVCTEVLEHTRQPFFAVNTLRQLLKPGGYCFVTTPFNFRIHGPLPDCWRFTEHGLRELFSDFDIVELTQVDDPRRFLMPIHYKLVARRKLAPPSAFFKS